MQVSTARLCLQPIDPSASALLRPTLCHTARCVFPSARNFFVPGAACPGGAPGFCVQRVPETLS